MPAKKIANPEHSELVKALAKAKADHKKKGDKLKALESKMTATEKDIVKMADAVEKATALAARLSSESDDAISAFQDSSSVMTELESQIKATPKQIAQD